MEDKSSGKSLESQYPSVDLAYEFVKPSYDWMVSRIETINNKIQGLSTFAVTITTALPIITKAIFNNIAFSSLWFYMAMVAFAFLVVTGIVGLRIGSIVLLNPKILYDKYLHYSHWEFKQMVIYWAGEHFNENKKLIDKKAYFRDTMTIFLLVEILCICLWIAMGRS